MRKLRCRSIILFISCYLKIVKKWWKHMLQDENSIYQWYLIHFLTSWYYLNWQSMRWESEQERESKKSKQREMVMERESETVGRIFLWIIILMANVMWKCLYKLFKSWIMYSISCIIRKTFLSFSLLWMILKITECTHFMFSRLFYDVH